MGEILGLPRVATIATLPSRVRTFEIVVRSILPQVDQLFVYLDHYPAVPEFLRGLSKTKVLRAEEHGDLHSSSRFLCLEELTVPACVVVVDDDIAYPSNYVARMATALDNWNGNAVVGVHGRIFVPPHLSYVQNAICDHFEKALERPRYVHEVGAGTCAFVSNRLPLRPRTFDRTDMSDLRVAIEAQKRGIPRVAIARPAGWLKPLKLDEEGSLWTRTRADEAEHSRLMRELLAQYTFLDSDIASI